MKNNTVKVRVRVTQKDIDAPCTGNRSENCPFARAINRILKSDCHSIVGNTRYFVDKRGRCSRSITAPKKMSDWIASYDCGSVVSPIRITLDLPKKALKRFKD